MRVDVAVEPALASAPAPALSSPPSSPPSRIARGLSGRGAGLGLAIVVLLLGLPALGNSLALDDLVLIEQFESAGTAGLYRFFAGDPSETTAARAVGELPWWTADSLEVDLWRPVTAWIFGLEQRLVPHAVWLRHLHSLVWYGLAVGAVLRIFRLVAAGPGGRGWSSPAAVAGLAALVWTVDDAHATSVGWIAARHAVVGMAIGGAGLVAHLRWREQGWGPGRFLGPAGLGLALLASESSIALWSYVLAHAGVRERGSWRERLRRLAPYGLVLVAWSSAYVGLGHGARACGMYLDVVGDPGGSALRLVAHAGLSAAAVLGPPMLVELAAFGPAAGYWGLAGACAVSLAVLALILRPVWRRSEWARVWSWGAMGAALATGLSLPADRHLLALGLGAAGLVAAVLSERLGRRPQGLALRGLAWTWLVLHLGLAPALFGLRATGTSVVQAEIDAAVDAMAPSRDADGVAVLVSAPSEVVAIYARATAAARGHDAFSLQVLHAGAGARTLRRVDDRTLELDADWMAAPAERIHRGPGYPMRPGQRIPCGALTFVVVAVDAHGWPRRVRVEAERSLDRSGWRWFVWEDGEPRALVLPEPGHELALEPAVWSFG